jgi:hypothetical protein
MEVCEITPFITLASRFLLIFSEMIPCESTNNFIIFLELKLIILDNDCCVTIFSQFLWVKVSYKAKIKALAKACLGKDLFTDWLLVGWCLLRVVEPRVSVSHRLVMGVYLQLLAKWVFIPSKLRRQQ